MDGSLIFLCLFLPPLVRRGCHKQHLATMKNLVHAMLLLRDFAEFNSSKMVSAHRSRQILGTYFSRGPQMAKTSSRLGRFRRSWVSVTIASSPIAASVICSSSVLGHMKLGPAGACPGTMFSWEPPQPLHVLNLSEVVVSHTPQSHRDISWR